MGGHIVKINWIEFENIETGLKIERINFFENITLLVGLSGAGKSQILDAIHYSLSLALGKISILYPYKCTIELLISEHVYCWSYTLQRRLNNEEFVMEDMNDYYFSNETLLCDGQLLFTRSDGNVKIESFQEVPTPKQDESLIYQYSDDSQFNELVVGLKKLYDIDIDLDVRGGFISARFNDLKAKINKTLKHKNDEDFKIFSHLPSLLKLYIARNHYYTQLFNKILTSVQSIFPEIEDIEVVEDLIREYYCVQITVYRQKLLQKDISNGMIKTIFYIVELYTASEDSLIMIDEFENGLGINCIDSISEIMLFERNDLQYIITSHHPKVINSIDYHCWKIIEREKHIIHNYDGNSDKFDLGGNRHDAYYNLLNAWAFENKI